VVIFKCFGDISANDTSSTLAGHHRCESVASVKEVKPLEKIPRWPRRIDRCPLSYVKMAPSSNAFASDLQPSSPSSTSKTSDLLDFQDDEGWEDAEPEDEDQEVKGLFSTEIFPNIRVMLQDCKDKHGFDFVRTTKELGVYVSGRFAL